MVSITVLSQGKHWICYIKESIKYEKWKWKIIQFGEGAFLRGFADWVVQLTNEATDFDASVVVVQPIANGLCQKLEDQNCVYTHVMRGIKNGETVVEKKVIDVISRTVEPYKDWNSYLALAENPDFRFFISNTTGIILSPSSNKLINTDALSKLIFALMVFL